MKEKENIKKKEYCGMKIMAIRGIGIRDNTKTYINGGRAPKKTGDR